MNLDEGIKWHSDEAEKLKDDNPEYAGQCKQIANWLMELKDLRILIGGEGHYLNEEGDSYDN